MANMHAINFIGDSITWSDLSVLQRKPPARSYASMFALGYNLYIMGGMPVEEEDAAAADISNDAMYVLRTFEDPVYIPQWVNASMLPDEPTPLAQASVCATGTDIWLLGGRRSLGAYPSHVMIRLATDPKALRPDVSCPRGFERDPPPFGSCVDIDECLLTLPRHNCHGNAACTNTLGSFTCACIEGYHTVPEAAVCPGDQVYVGEGSTRPGQECVDVDECSPARDPERQFCNYHTYVDAAPPFIPFSRVVQVA